MFGNTVQGAFRALARMHSRLPVPLGEIVSPLAPAAADESWRNIGRERFSYDPKSFLERYLSKLLKDVEFQAKRDGEVVILIGRTAYDLYALLEEKMERHRGPYTAYGVLVFFKHRVGFYKWERRENGELTRDSCDHVFSFSEPQEVRDVIGPAIRSMFSEVGKAASQEIRVLQVGVDCEKKDPMETRRLPNWTDYPMFYMA